MKVELKEMLQPILIVILITVMTIDMVIDGFTAHQMWARRAIIEEVVEDVHAIMDRLSTRPEDVLNELHQVEERLNSLEEKLP